MGIRKTIRPGTFAEVNAQVEEFMAGLDRVPDYLLMGTKIYALYEQDLAMIGVPFAFVYGDNAVPVRQDRNSDWDVAPMRKLM